MNYIYLLLGVILGVVFLGRAKNAKKQKFVPYEVKMKLKNKKNMEEYDEWCKGEANGCSLMGIGFIIFGLSATFMDSNVLISNILSIVAFVVFIVGFFSRVINNKKRIGHYFTKQ